MKFTCDICNKEFASKQSLQAHRAVHFRQKILTPKDRKKYIDPNDPELVHECINCHKKFKSVYALCGHMAYCNDEEKTECPYCNKLINKLRYNNHLKRCEKEYKKFDNLVINEDYVVCKICNKRAFSLKRHLGTKHGITAKEYYKQFPNAKIVANNVEKRSKQTYNEHYGIDSRGAAFPHNPINKCEKLLNSITPSNVIFVDNKFFVSAKIENNDKPWVKNPDFIVVDEDDLPLFLNELTEYGFIKNLELKHKVKKVIEHFGDYWHGECITGIPNDVHEQQIINNYKLIGIDCLIIWEHELKDLDRVKNKINNFILS